jgi:hypothetical protein
MTKKSARSVAGDLDLETAAQRLSDCADAFNATIKEAIAAGQLDREAAFQHLAREQMLRSLANQLHFDAALGVVAGLTATQADLDAALDAATTKIRSLQRFSAVLTLVADVLALGAAISARQPAVIVAALNCVRNDADKLSDKA